MPVKTILVAEDDANVRAFLVTALGRAGYRVLAAADGSQAIAILRDTATVIDAVVSDVDMPGATGLEVVAFASSGRPGIGYEPLDGGPDPGWRQAPAEAIHH